MQRPLFLLLLSTLSYASEAATNASAWNCEQSKDGKEWVCSGDTKSAEPVPTTQIETPIITPEPIAVQKTAETTAPIEIEKQVEPIIAPPPIEKVIVKEVEKLRPV